MNTSHRVTSITLCCTIALLVACGKGGDQAADTTGATAAADVPPPGISAADVSGKWNMTAVPETGNATPTTFVLAATGANTGWTLTFPNRPPVALSVTIAGDSITAASAPYESVRRKGVQVTNNSVIRLQDGNMVGSAVAHYTTKGADSVVRLRLTGTRAP
jgi:hypothetical protein